MPPTETVSRVHVLHTLREHDEVGADEFLNRYGFGSAREYLLWHNGKSYDSKAVLGAASRYAGAPTEASQGPAADRSGAAKVLRGLGFDIRLVDDLARDDDSAGGGWREASEVGDDAARAAWATAARELLLEVAGRYNATMTYKELAAQVQYRTGVRTSQQMRMWIGDVLARVEAECARKGEPLLSALCVNPAGGVGDGYAANLLAATSSKPENADDHAARERLACHRFFGASDLPPDGGSATLTPKMTATRARQARARAQNRPVSTCPTCFTQLPTTGTCDFCD